MIGSQLQVLVELSILKLLWLLQVKAAVVLVQVWVVVEDSDCAWSCWVPLAQPFEPFPASQVYFVVSVSVGCVAEEARQVFAVSVQLP